MKIASLITCLMLLSSLGSAASLPDPCDWPDRGFLVQGNHEVPANAVGVVWAGTLATSGGIESLPGVDHFKFYRAYGKSWVACPFRLEHINHRFRDPSSTCDMVLVVPAQGLDSGARYRVGFTARDGRPLIPLGESSPVANHEIEFTVSTDSLLVTEAMRQAVHDLEIDNSVSRGIEISDSLNGTERFEVLYRDIAMPTIPELDRWGESLLYVTTVSPSTLHFYRAWHPRSTVCGIVPPGRSWIGLGRDRIFTIIGEVPFETSPMYNLDPGMYRIRLHAYLPGTRQSLTSFGQARLGGE